MGRCSNPSSYTGGGPRVRRHGPHSAAGWRGRDAGGGVVSPGVDIWVMTDAELLAWIVEEGAALCDAARGRAGSAISSCPGWTMADLVAHVAPVYRGWFTSNVGRSPHEECDLATASAAARVSIPDTYEQRVDFVAESTAEFAAFAAGQDLDGEVWAFGSNKPRRFWVHRAATEIALHRWDAESAVGTPTPLSAERAATSLDELVMDLWPALVRLQGTALVADFAVPEDAAGMRAVDSGRSWRFGRTADHDVAIRTDELPRTVVAGAGQDLVLYQWGRVDLDALSVQGEPSQVAGWRLCGKAGW